MDLEDRRVRRNSTPEPPVDVTAVQADEALLDMLAGIGPEVPIEDAELSRVLTAWRRDIGAAPIPQLVSTDTALAVIAAARGPRRSWLGRIRDVVLRPLGGAR